jgi:hypothetical protein
MYLKYPILFISLVVTLASCSQVASVGSDPENLNLSGNLNNQVFRSEVATLEVDAKALDGDATLSVKRVDTRASLRIPPVDGVNSSFIMGEVPDKKFVGAWQVKTSGPQFTGGAALTVNGPSMEKSSSDTITELFSQNNTTGKVDLVGTYLSDQPIKIDNFSDLINDLKKNKQDTGLTFFAYSSSQTNYNKTCADQGGTTKYQSCSFAEKVLPTATVKSTRAVSNMRMLSWNVGNVAVTCVQYIYKDCYRVTERKISDVILGLEQTGGTPEVILLQELWHGNCKYQNENNWFTNYFNPRLCAPGLAGTSSIERILGAQGVRYNYMCSNTADLPNEPVTGQFGNIERYGLVLNGYECVAVRARGEIQLNYTYSVQPSCVGTNPDMNTNYLGRDVGVVMASARYRGLPLTLGSVHLTGIDKPDCRAVEIDTLRKDELALHPAHRLIAGDFNTEAMPYTFPFIHADGTAGGAAFRNAFSGVWGTPQNAYGKVLDNVFEPTAFYPGYTPSLDHVISDAFTGFCTRGIDIGGTDHTWTDCRLSSSYY